MQGQFTARADDTMGRPRKEIPAALRKTLDTTYDNKTDYVVEGRIGGAEFDQLVSLGRLYATRRGLSFRYRITDEQPDGSAKIRFRLTDKRPYIKRDSNFWESK